MDYRAAPHGKKSLGCKWVFKIKRKTDGSMEQYKAHLVVKGFIEVEGLDFHETFAPVAKLLSVRVLLTVALHKNWELYQIDANNAFLHRKLDKEKYMQLPLRLPSMRNKVYRLQKLIYGPCQASRNWFLKFSNALKNYGFIQSMVEYSLFTYVRGGPFMEVLILVGDIIFAGSNVAQYQLFKEYLHQNFNIGDLGRLKYFLRIKVAHNDLGLFLPEKIYYGHCKGTGDACCQTSVIFHGSIFIFDSIIWIDNLSPGKILKACWTTYICHNHMV